jgi:curved DNA-binding protein CbpA
MAPRGLLSAPPRAGTSSYKILGMDMKEVALLFNTANSDDDAALDAMVKRQYRAMALKCHPDKHSGTSERQQDYASAWIKLINEAAELTRSVERRNLYHLVNKHKRDFNWAKRPDDDDYGFDSAAADETWAWSDDDEKDKENSAPKKKKKKAKAAAATKKKTSKGSTPPQQAKPANKRQKKSPVPATPVDESRDSPNEAGGGWGDFNSGAAADVTMDFSAPAGPIASSSSSRCSSSSTSTSSSSRSSSSSICSSSSTCSSNICSSCSSSSICSRNSSICSSNICSSSSRKSCA